MIDTEQGFLVWWEGFAYLDESSAWKVFRAMLDLEKRVREECATKKAAA